MIKFSFLSQKKKIFNSQRRSSREREAGDDGAAAGIQLIFSKIPCSSKRHIGMTNANLSTSSSTSSSILDLVTKIKSLL